MADLIDFQLPILEEAPANPASLLVTNVTSILMLPINCVIAGQQPEQKKAIPLGTVPSNLRGIFKE